MILISTLVVLAFGALAPCQAGHGANGTAITFYDALSADVVQWLDSSKQGATSSTKVARNPDLRWVDPDATLLTLPLRSSMILILLSSRRLAVRLCLLPRSRLYSSVLLIQPTHRRIP